ncbi:LysM peptidoglycan-binding domain-containing protein [Enterobacteriaceae bacterium LUAb1]
MNLYKYLHAEKGSQYRKNQLAKNSLINIYPEIDESRKLRGNSRVFGDVDKKIQNTIIDMLIIIATRYLLSYKEIAYILLVAKIESGFNPDAAAGTTSAGGLAQETAEFITYIKNHSKDILGFTLDLEDEGVFDAEKGCYALVYSFMLNKSKVLEHYTIEQNEYWEWLYYLHHDGINSLTDHLAGKHIITKEGKKCASGIINELPFVENLIKSDTVKTRFKLSTGDGNRVADKNYIAAVSFSSNSVHPDMVSDLEKPFVLFKGKTDKTGKTDDIPSRAGSEIVFTILRDNYNHLAIANNINKEEQQTKNALPHRIYTVKYGDTLTAIARNSGVSLEKIARLNRILNINYLRAGETLKIPDNPKHTVYIGRYVSEEVKKALLKQAGIESANTKAVIAYSRSHISLPKGSQLADTDKEENIIHIKTTATRDAIINREKQFEKHQTNQFSSAKKIVIKNNFEPVIVFSRDVRNDLVSAKTLNIIKKILKKVSVHKVLITSTFRTPARQAKAMYGNMIKHGIESQLAYYKSNGKAVILAGVDAGGIAPDKRDSVLAAMTRKINEINNSGNEVSRHCVDEDMYKKRNVIDIGKISLDNLHLSEKLDKSIEEYIENHTDVKYISPFKYSGESAFHLEVKQ